MTAELKYNVDISGASKKYDRLGRLSTKYLKLAMNDAFFEIGQTAASDHIDLGPDGLTQTDKLTSRSGRLVRSLVNGFNFSGGAGGEKEGVRRIRITKDEVRGEYGSKAPHAAIHEYGGEIPVTAKSRAFFMYQYLDTGIEAWLNMSLTKKGHFDMPARPYLEPALKSAEEAIYAHFQARADELAAEINNAR